MHCHHITSPFFHIHVGKKAEINRYFLLILVVDDLDSKFGSILHKNYFQCKVLFKFIIQYIVKLHNSMADNAEHFWNLLNKDNKVSLLVKFIDKENKNVKIKIINKNV